MKKIIRYMFMGILTATLAYANQVDEQRFVDLVASTLLKEDRVLVVLEPVSRKDLPSRFLNIDSELSRLRPEDTSAKTADFYRVINNIGNLSQYVLRIFSWRDISNARRPYPELNTAGFSPSPLSTPGQLWLCVVDITDVLTLGGEIEGICDNPYDYSVIEYPDIFNGNFEFKEESRLGENLIVLFDDLKVIECFLKLENFTDLPVLKTDLGRKILQRVLSACGGHASG